MKKYLTYIMPPLVVVLAIWLSTIIFGLLSASSDVSVAIGAVLGVLSLVILYHFILSLFNSICR